MSGILPREMAYNGDHKRKKMELQMIDTNYAPAERVDAEILKQQRSVFSEETSLMSLMNAVPNIVLILNEERQIV